MQQDPLISVIIPVFNAEQYLRRALDSVCNQTHRNLEIICVNDGSTDASLDILQEYAAKDDRIFIINQKNKKAGAARNAGLKQAHGDFVTSLDPDDYLDLETYAEIAPLLTDQMDMFVFGAELHGPDCQRKRNLTKYYHIKQEELVQLKDEMLLFINVSVCLKLFRRSVIEENHIRFPEGIVYEDVSFCFKFFSVSKYAYLQPKKYYHVMMRDTSVMGVTTHGHISNLDYFATLDDALEFLKSHGLWEKHQEMVRQILGLIFFKVKDVPAELTLQAQRLANKLIQKWDLHILFPNEPGFKNWPPTSTSLRGLIRKLFYKEKATKRTYLMFGIPLLTIQKKNGILKYRALGIPVCSKPV